ncbi:MAG: hypothetical protein RBR77_03885 [Thauera sp.]|jgi:hypothetical protein|nr:hypothetical protein [Thauera sp.]
MLLIFFELGIALILLLIVAWALRAPPREEERRPPRQGDGIDSDQRADTVDKENE